MITKESISKSLLEAGTTCINCDADGDTNFNYEMVAVLTEKVTCNQCEYSWEVSLAHLKVDCVYGPNKQVVSFPGHNEGSFREGRHGKGIPLRNFAEAVQEMRALVEFYKNPAKTGYSPKRQAELIASLDRMLPL